ncbi:MAG: tRNA uridine-5-carboxymethylaminomethyl(34) synthesis GTPase MnmE [Clostridia bacterium]|nr:tRNA uridine-5-carboxymethylaminomethyl(34) synthesis GTPase MnmE [Clostridia bacterium]
MDTIIALSTPPTLSAIAIVRLSGKECLGLVKEIFSGFKKDVKPRYMYYGILDTGKIKDDCMCVYFSAPNSYTGEDMVEINCHGSVAVTESIIEYFIEKGVRMAEKGEFTKKAFVNGKMDLTQSEAVIDLINAQSEAQARSAYSQLSGALYGRISALQKRIVTAIAKIEVSLDYPEEEIEEATKEESKAEIESIKEEIISLKNTYNSGKILREGVKIAIVGKPNVGKSKLLNALLGYERAIVTDIEGTTRDILSESYQYNGIKFTLVDTAGIRKTDDTVEKIGVSLALKEAKECDVLLHVIEAGSEFEKVETSAKVVYVENKTDKLQPKRQDSVKISALTGEGIEDLKKRVYDVACKNVTVGESRINNLRHLNAVERALSNVYRALENIDFVTLDLISSDLNNAYRELGSITGITSEDEIVGEIFSKFCVGK